MFDDVITIDDAVVVEYRDALSRPVTRRALGALERSLRMRGLQPTWKRAITDKDGFAWDPPLGRAWDTWFNVLRDQGLAVTPVHALLADAGVLPPFDESEARDLVWHVHGWS